MTLQIDGIRELAVSDEAYPLLVELMKFRHFRRYYFELDYDWERLDYLCAKFVRVRPLVTRDMAVFVSFLDALRQAP
ncbi:MAG: hypothetical protein HY343_13605 [Lentisphaerae bacterium]|nr:hypothetical protein [Lentisphaerota bacterium]